MTSRVSVPVPWESWEQQRDAVGKQRRAAVNSEKRLRAAVSPGTLVRPQRPTRVMPPKGRPAPCPGGLTTQRASEWCWGLPTPRSAGARLPRLERPRGRRSQGHAGPSAEGHARSTRVHLGLPTWRNPGASVPRSGGSKRGGGANAPQLAHHAAVTTHQHEQDAAVTTQTLPVPACTLCAPRRNAPAGAPSRQT